MENILKAYCKQRVFSFFRKNKLAIRTSLLLDSKIITLNSYQELLRLFHWKKEPILDESQVHLYEYVLDVNQRRLRDAESIMTVCANVGTSTLLEIGTAHGITTASMALNAPLAQVYTVNILPEEAEAGEGGKLITNSFPRDAIGSYFREKNIKNITQIYANTLTWEPNIGTIDVAFIDGCHDKDFVINDTLKILPHMRPGGFILWHDFNPNLAMKHGWIAEVCAAVAWLQAKGHIGGDVYHVKDSWVGIWQVPGKV